MLAQEELPVTILLVDDGGYGMLRYDQVHAGDPVRGVDLMRPDFAGLAAAFKIDSVELEAGDPPAYGEALGAALDEALASGRPRMIVLRRARSAAHDIGQVARVSAGGSRPACAAWAPTTWTSTTCTHPIAARRSRRRWPVDCGPGKRSAATGSRRAARCSSSAWP